VQSPETIDELAMVVAIASLDVPEETREEIFDLILHILPAQARVEQLRTEMELRFGVYETQQAIKQAQEVLSMVVSKPEDPFVVVT
jgi:hypothetical protein